MSTVARRIAKLHRRFPHWDAAKIAQEVGTTPTYVRTVSVRMNFNLPRKQYPQDTFRRRRGSIIGLGRACRAAGLTLADIEALKGQHDRDRAQQQIRQGSAQVDHRAH